MKYCYLLLFTVIICNCSLAQTPVMLKDINRLQNGSAFYYGVANYTDVNGTVFFTADDGWHGIELWKTDGTSAGTMMVKDINPGINTSSPGQLINFNGTLFFSALGELWKSDGTDEGTVLIKDILPVGQWSEPQNLTVVNNVLFFSASTNATGAELWKTDGTTDGTVLVKDIVPGIYPGAPKNLLDVNGTLFFAGLTGNTGAGGFKLWKSDGTATGTVLVKDVLLSAGGGDPGIEMSNLDGTLFFKASNGSNGFELWKSDGSTAGTVMVKDINPSGESTPTQLTVVDSILYFTAVDGTEGTTRRLWKSNGTADGTVAITNANGHRLSALSLTAHNRKLFFSGSNDVSGFELWQTNGTAQGTFLVKDIVAGSASSSPWLLTSAGNILFFEAEAADSSGLWKTDGTPEGTINIMPSGPIASSLYNSFYSVGNKLFFITHTDSIGREPWTSDGTAEGTSVLKDINVVTNGSSPFGFTQLGDHVYFSANDGIHGAELWRTDGTANGTNMVKDIFPGSGSAPNTFTRLNGQLYFVANNRDDFSQAVFKTDGTEAGTVLLGNTDPSNTYVYLGALFALHEKVVFKGSDGVHGTQLWKSDGTNEGTSMITGITPGTTGLNFGFLYTVVDGTLYFTVDDGINGVTHEALWKTDGTTAGTVLVKSIGPRDAYNSMGEFTDFNGKLFFTVSDGIHGSEVWQTDGTELGTTLLIDLVPGAETSNPEHLKVAGNYLYFSAKYTVTESEGGTTGLYRTDGTAAGTRETRAANGRRFAFGHQDFTLVDSLIFFTATSPIIGRELWKMDSAGTSPTLIKDIYPGDSGLDPVPLYLTAINGILYFNANSPEVGHELWRSDGTPEGTIPYDIAAGAEWSSFPYGLTKFNNSLLFYASDPVHNGELWMLKMEPFIWTGAVNTDWELPGNWSTNEVPTASSVVIIPSGKVNYPIVHTTTGIRSISCAPGSAVTLLIGVGLSIVK